MEFFEFYCHLKYLKRINSKLIMPSARLIISIALIPWYIIDWTSAIVSSFLVFLSFFGYPLYQHLESSRTLSDVHVHDLHCQIVLAKSKFEQAGAYKSSPCFFQLCQDTICWDYYRNSNVETRTTPSYPMALRQLESSFIVIPWQAPKSDKSSAVL